MPPKAATLEQDFFLLDGSLSLFPDTASLFDWGVWWEELSNEEGAFSQPQELTVEFLQDHSSAGLTLDFDPHSQNWPSSVEVRWFAASGQVLSRGVFSQTGNRWRLQNKVENYRKLVIGFLGTSRPYCFCKLCGLDYGIEKVWEGEELVEANLTEELDPISAALPLNTLQWSIYSQNGDFDLLNPKGAYSLLQQGQKVDAAGWIDKTKVELGSFYLENWQSLGNGQIRLTARDAVSLMERKSFLGGIYNSISGKALMGEIFGVAGVPVSFSEDLPDSLLSGWLPVCSCREALRRVAFAMGAVVDCSRQKEVKVALPDHRPTILLSQKSKLEGQEMQTRDTVEAVELTCHTYSADSQVKRLYEGTLQTGSHRLYWSQPTHSLTITGGVIEASGANYADITVSTLGTVVVSGYGYAEGKQVVTAKAQLPVGATGKTVSITHATLLTQDSLSIASRVAQYCALPFTSTVTMLPNTCQTGQMAVVQCKGGRQLKGVIEMIETNLTGGFLSRLRLVGSAIETISGYYCGEVVTGEEMGVL